LKTEPAKASLRDGRDNAKGVISSIEASYLQMDNMTQKALHCPHAWSELQDAL
jgi:hypothetical protein